ncbi:hypothetical protein ACTXNA_07355 [Psychrobacter celer]|uniref:hypothetical protein n=1 Tax=Psychrobacter celer TaxID=306572 RepID=UPI003FD50760
MDIQEIKSRFEEHDMRCEEMHPLFMTPLTTLYGRLSEIILDDHHFETVEALGITEEERFQLDSRDDLEELLYAKKLDGFLACFAKPIVKPIGDSGSHSCSWGYYRTTWLYADSISELSQKAIKWAEEVFEKDMAK